MTLTQQEAQHIIRKLGESGIPPTRGLEAYTVGMDSALGTPRNGAPATKARRVTMHSKIHRTQPGRLRPVTTAPARAAGASTPIRETAVSSAPVPRVAARAPG